MLTLTFLRRQASHAASTAGRRGGRDEDAADDEDECKPVAEFGGGSREAGNIGTWFGGMACDGIKAMDSGPTTVRPVMNQGLVCPRAYCRRRRAPRKLWAGEGGRGLIYKVLDAQQI